LQVNPQASREVTVRELSRATGSGLEEVSAGKRMVITRHGNPVALILAIDDAIEVFLAHAEEFVRMWLAAREEFDAAREELDAAREGLDAAREEPDRSERSR
jgi:prevent-host-death family protein